ncbi:hypothetical protein GY21_12570 [Cryobacterium roopkundense]|uniref:Bacterial spore germination immunoglobulin-like domain-containing protein n=1 Tax=Cryobacterium roopkundense TaxID=1001240 RepID=A0A099J465_9MICO|nr:Gmad2 immunoglobulin-like domain-containing protein [Cryobacterium roopkundense]KGJ72875.1 hypothetical protein GY21_12570 [Cryobacterium roopkundense]MBB5643126.1 hypothetical protein [Cryobacterium roopkundense]
MSSRRGLSLIAVAALVLVIGVGCASEDPAPTASPSPTESTADSTVSTPVELSETADTFEAALTVDALDAAGKQLCVRSILATSGSGTPGTWRTMLAFAPPSTATPVTLRAYDFSAKDGSMQNLVQRPVTVSADHPAIYITSPTCGSEVAPGSVLKVTGRALVFEAMFTVELRDSVGATIVNTEVTAESGTEESNFTADLAVPADAVSGYYDLVAFDNSAKDGSVIDEFSIQLLVQ